MDETQKILVKKAFKKELAHFYMLEPSTTVETELLEEWCTELIMNIRMNTGDSITKTQVLNHQEVLYVRTDAKSYTLDDFNEFFNFLSHKAYFFDRKYIVISDAHKLSVKVANKLLKTLEEPQIEVCILMLNNTKKNLLDTVSSRSIKLRVKFEAIKEENQVEFFEDHLVLAQKLKKDSKLEKSYQSYILDAAQKQDLSLETLSKIKSYFKEFNEDNEYNNPIITRAFNLQKLLAALQGK